MMACLRVFAWIFVFIHWGNGQTSLDLSTCGTIKGCFLFPSNCDTFDGCSIGATWRPGADNSTVVLELFARDISGPVGWVGLGLSSDKGMGGDSVTACTQTTPNPSARQTYNQGTATSAPLDDPSFGLVLNDSHTSGSSLLVCTITRQTGAPTGGTDDDKSKFFSAHDPYYLLLGYGPATSGGDLQQHHTNPLISADKITLTSTTGAEDGTSHALIKAHGTLMVVSWVFCISISVIVARFFKQGFGDREVFGKKLWFVIHVSLNLACLVLTLVSFILIFVHAEGYTSSSSSDSGSRKAHPILGILVTALVIINPVMAIFRPAPDADKRVIFNLAHRGVGFVAEIVACVNIFLGVRMREADVFVADWILIPIIIFAVAVTLTKTVLEILYIQQNKTKRSATSNNDVQLSGLNIDKTPNSFSLENEDDMSYYKVSLIIFMVYLVVNISLTVTIIVAIV